MLHHWKIIFLNTPTPPSPLLDQLWPHLTTFLLLSILINSQLQEMEKGNVFFSWRDTEVSFRGSRGMWQSQHSSSSTQSHSGMLDMLELQDTSEKSPTTNTTWFWGGPGQGCSQFGKMILRGAGFSADSSAHWNHSSLPQISKSHPNIRWISHSCVYKSPQKRKIKTKMVMSNSEIFYTKLVPNQN